MSGTSLNLALASRGRAARGGFVAVFFAILLVVFLAVMALVVDMGFLNLSRRQMQAAVNAAAREGLRFRDGVPPAWQNAATAPPGLIADYAQAGYDPTDLAAPQYYDFARRWAAANMAGQTLYAPDRNQMLSRALRVNVAANPNSPLPPVLQSIDPANPYDGYPPSPLVQPVLQPNLSENAAQADNIAGDLVAGEYSDDPNVPAPYGPQYAHLQTPISYTRYDFAPDSRDNSPAAFLRGMRRTGEGFTGSDQSRTSGDKMTMLFTGLGVSGSSGGALQATVRATAIATAQPAVSVGPMFYWIDPATGNPRWITGAAPISATAASLVSSAFLQSGGQVTDGNGQTLFTILDVSSSDATTQQPVTLGYSVGQTYAPPASTTIAFPQSAISGSAGFLVYVPIVDDASRVIGFGAMRIYMAGAVASSAAQSTIAPENASAAFPTTSPLGTLSPADFASVLAEHNQLSNPLMAPALVRAVSLPQPPTITHP